MTLKELKQHYLVLKWNGNYLVHSLAKTTTSRIPHKYLCEVEKVGNAFFIVGGSGVPAKNLNIFQSQVETYLSELKYSSEYYYPVFSDEFRSECFVRDLLSEYEFERMGYSDTWKFSRKNIFGALTTDIELSYDITHEVVFKLYLNNHSWLTIKSNLDFDDIKQTLDSMLKPLLLTEGVRNIKSADAMGNPNPTVNYVLNELRGLDVESENVNAILKEKLLTLANSL